MGLEVYSGVLQDLLRPCSRKSAESVGKLALKAATEVGKDVLDGKSFKESTNHAEEKFLKTWQIKEQMLYYIRLEEERREG